LLKPFFKTLLAVAVIFILTAPSLQADQLKPKKTVLLIHAFEPFMPYSVTVNQSIRTTLGADKTLHLDLYPEYLDLSRFPDETYRQRLLGHLRYKYAKRAPDLIFIMLNPAFDFVLGNIEKLFPHAPIVLCSVEKYQIEGRILRPNITGVLMAIDPKGTIDAALRLQPETKKVVVVAGIQKNDKVYEGVVRHALKEYEGRLQITYLTGVPLGIVLETVSGLSKDTIVFYITIFQDGTGKSYVPRDIATIVSRTSSVPVYAMFDSYFGYGIVGGHLVSFEKQGEKAAEIGLRILHGEKPNNIPMTPGAHVYKFDWREMKRWNISEANLPPGSIVEYRDFTTWERYRWQIIGIILFAIIESLLIVVLLIQRIKRRKAEKALFASEQKYRSIFENSIEGIYQSTPEGRLLTVNPALAHMHGYSSVSEMMQDVADSVEALYVNNEDRKKYQDIIREQEFIREFETELYRKDGSTFLASRNARIIRDNEGKVIYYEGIIQDVTERRKLENQLRQSQKMEAIGQLAGGIAHDFNNILTVIIGLGELVRMKIGVEYPLRGYMDQIMASAEKAAKLTQSLLAFSRQHKINLEPHNMDQIVESSGILLKRLLTEDIRLEIRLNSDDATIMADTTQIGLVLINLATNARDAMPRGGRAAY
jgi:PAS domain S-box-containing protein